MVPPGRRRVLARLRQSGDAERTSRRGQTGLRRTPQPGRAVLRRPRFPRTMLVIRELLLGNRHFNDIRRGVPKMSPSLLSKRLHDLRRIVEIWRSDLGWPAAIRSGLIQLDGPERFGPAVLKWFPASQFAQVRRSAIDLTSLAG